MKIKIVGGGIAFLLLLLSILLFIEDDSKIVIITSPKVYSIVKSSDFETFDIALLTNNSNSYYFSEDYISKIAIVSNNEELIPLTLHEIIKTTDNYIYNDKMYSYLAFSVQLGFDSNDFEVLMDKAYLQITYKNAEEIKVYIGEINYLFASQENYDMSVNNLLSTHGIVNNIDTSTGLFLNLGNLSNGNITINKVEIGSNDVACNNYYLKEVYDVPKYDASVENILGLETYAYENNLEITNASLLLRKNNEILFYVPFTYSGEINYLYRFYVKVYYTYNSVEKVFIIDDFPYINTSSFKTELEKDFYYYEFSN